MNQALGEFLTAVGHLEFRMMMLMALVGEPDIDVIFAETSKLTLGAKIDYFKKHVEFYRDNFSPDNWKHAENISAKLKTFVTTRNSLVHGETWHEVLPGRQRQPYRVGVEKENIDYLAEFSRGEPKGTVYDVEQVRQATKSCLGIRDEIDLIMGGPSAWD